MSSGFSIITSFINSSIVKEVNICLEMLEAEQYPVQMMGEKEKGSSLGAHLGNQQSSGRTLYHKYNISE